LGIRPRVDARLPPATRREAAPADRRSFPFAAALGKNAATMFEWIHGRPSVLVRASDVKAWPGGQVASSRTVAVRHLHGKPALVLGGSALTTAVPLELGGLLLVGAVFCDSDDSLASHLDMMPTVGWELAPDRFDSDGAGHVLFDGSRAGTELDGPTASETVRAETGGLVPVALEPGSYEVEVLGPWSPDERTELWLTRLVRAAPPAR
jgi:hypothetical protein